MPRSLCLATLFLGFGCAASAANDGVVWIDGESFAAPKRGFFEGLFAPFAGGEEAGARLAAALDHNCPLDEVEVAATSTEDATSFVIDVCGEEKRYAFDGAIYFERVAVKVPTAVAAPEAAPQQTPAPPTAPAPEPPRGKR